MTDSIYNYSKSSCNCDDCINPNNMKGYPTNLSIKNCTFADCYDSIPFKQNIEPSNREGIQYINPQTQMNYAKGFQKIECKDSSTYDQGFNKNCKNVYISTDPRLIDVPRSILTALNVPPQDSSVNLNDINSDKKLNNYGQNYKTYKDINAGQIMYYTDSSIQDAFFEPNFTTSVEMVGTIYKDPMGSIKPQYDRYPIKCNDHLNTENINYDGGLSWIADSQEHRQDLMSKQMAKRNQERWMTRWN